MDKFKAKETIIFDAPTTGLEGKILKATITLLDKNKTKLATPEELDAPVINGVASCEFTVETIAENKSVELSEVKYVEAWLDANGDGEVNLEYDKSIMFEVKKTCLLNVNKFILEYEKDHTSVIGWYEKDRKTKKYYKTTLSKLNSISKNNLMRLIKELILYYEESTYECSIPKLSYILATIRLESYQWEKREFFGLTSEDISYEDAEIDYGCGLIGRRAAIAKKNGCRVDGDGFKYRGRGFVQITWKINYEKFNGIKGIDFVKAPDEMLDFIIQVAVTIEGMERGLFSDGNKLSTYINENTKNYLGARRIINGTDKDYIIADYAKGIEECLLKSI